MRPIRWLRQTWRDTTHAVRVCLIVMWITSGVFLAGGLFGDSQGFWGNKPFATNVLTGLTGALFGIPLALLVFQQISNQQDAQREARAARRLASRVSAELHASVRKLIIEPAVLRAIEMAISNLITMDDPSTPGTDIGWNKIRVALSALDQECNDVVAPAKQYAEAVAEAHMRLTYLNNEIRSQMLETDNKWLDAATSSALSTCITNLGDVPGVWLKLATRAAVLRAPGERINISDLDLGQSELDWAQEWNSQDTPKWERIMTGVQWEKITIALQRETWEMQNVIKAIHLTGAVAETFRGQ